MKASTTDLDLEQVPPRKRTQRACDQCRRRRTKCDGESKCKTCRMIGLDCSYGVAVKQSRGPAYIAYLENKVKELQAEVEFLQTDLDRNSSGSEGNAADSFAVSAVSSPVNKGTERYSSNAQEPGMARSNLSPLPNPDSRPAFPAPFDFAQAPLLDEGFQGVDSLAFPVEVDFMNGYDQSVPFQYSSPTEPEFFAQTLAAPIYPWNTPRRLF